VSHIGIVVSKDTSIGNNEAVAGPLVADVGCRRIGKNPSWPLWLHLGYHC